MSLPPQGPPPHGSPWPYGQPPYGQQPPQAQSWQGSPSPYGQPQQWQQAGPPIQPKKSGLGKAIVIVVVGLSVGVMALIGYALIKVSGEGQDRQADSPSAFAQVCDKDWISTAPEYGKPYNIAAFYKGLGFMGETWLPVPSNEWATSNNFSKINVVACLDRKTGSEAKSIPCVFDDDGSRITVDYYSAEYTIELREAKTGKVIKDLGTVSGTADSCPFIASYERRSKKMYAAPDGDAVAAKLAEFAG
ncbi:MULTISPECIES: hypothetical protein [Mycolicibacterium]|uniref:hypothetical protein n=1 Tax=Mycolicibacterium TaxID=1866885 RepID=UPI0009C186CC|nr:hypothetical protein [Mycolicibacterium fortuitum]